MGFCALIPRLTPGATVFCPLRGLGRWVGRGGAADLISQKWAGIRGAEAPQSLRLVVRGNLSPVPGGSPAGLMMGFCVLIPRLAPWGQRLAPVPGPVGTPVPSGLGWWVEHGGATLAASSRQGRRNMVAPVARLGEQMNSSASQPASAGVRIIATRSARRTPHGGSSRGRGIHREKRCVDDVALGRECIE